MADTADNGKRLSERITIRTDAELRERLRRCARGIPTCPSEVDLARLAMSLGLAEIERRFSSAGTGTVGNDGQTELMLRGR
jgi:hypothetical protein